MEEPQAEQPQVVQQAAPQTTNFWLIEGSLRSIWSVSAYFFAALFLSVVLVILSSPLNMLLDWRFVHPLVMLVAALGVSAIMAIAVDRGSFLDLTALHWSKAAPWHLAAGITVAGLLMAVLLLLELLFGDARIVLGQVTFSYVSVLLLNSLISFTLVGFAEEILTRGYPFTILERRSGKVWALMITAVIFSLMHAFNPGIGWFGFANIFLAGIWLGAARLISGALWLPIGMHIGWNFFLGPVFGFPVSGVFEKSVFITKVAGAEWLTGGNFGPEGGLLATVVLLAGTAALYLPGISRLLSTNTATNAVAAKSEATEHKDAS